MDFKHNFIKCNILTRETPPHVTFVIFIKNVSTLALTPPPPKCDEKPSVKLRSRSGEGQGQARVKRDKLKDLDLRYRYHKFGLQPFAQHFPSL